MMGTMDYCNMDSCNKDQFYNSDSSVLGDNVRRKSNDAEYSPLTARPSLSRNPPETTYQKHSEKRLTRDADRKDEKGVLLLAFTESTCSVMPPRPKNVWDAGGGPGWLEGRVRMGQWGFTLEGSRHGGCSGDERALLGLRLRPVAEPRPRGFPHHLDLGHVTLFRPKILEGWSNKSAKSVPALVVSRPDHPCAVANSDPDIFCFLILSGVQEDATYIFAVSTIRLLEEEEKEEEDEEGREGEVGGEEAKKFEDRDVSFDTYPTNTETKEREEIRLEKIGEGLKTLSTSIHEQKQIIRKRREKNYDIKSSDNTKGGRIRNSNGRYKYRNAWRVKTMPYKNITGNTGRSEIKTDENERWITNHKEIKSNKSARTRKEILNAPQKKKVRKELTEKQSETLKWGIRQWPRGRRRESAPWFVALHASPCDPTADGSCNVPGEAPNAEKLIRRSVNDTPLIKNDTQKTLLCDGAVGQEAVAVALIALIVAVLLVGAPLAFIMGKRSGAKEDKLRWIQRGGNRREAQSTEEEQLNLAAAGAAEQARGTTAIVHRTDAGQGPNRDRGRPLVRFEMPKRTHKLRPKRHQSPQSSTTDSIPFRPRFHKSRQRN